MIFFSLTIIIFIFIYGCAGIFYFRYLQTTPSTFNDFEPSVSVIVAARNEAANLPACLESLLTLEYPEKKLEIIFVNDFSTDNSKEILDEFQQKNNSIEVINLYEKKKRPGKAGALLEGIEKSSGEIIFVTDADCKIPKTWIKTILRMFDEQTGVSGGFTFIEPTTNLNWWPASQTLELMFLQAAAFIYARLNRPVSWLGNNLAFRRSAYIEVGGFQNLDETLVEDYALINAIRQRANWRSRFCLYPAAVVKSQPVENLNSLYNQRKRWASDRNKVPVDGLVVMLLNYITRFLLLLSILVTPIYISCPLMLLLIAFDFIFLFRIAKIFNKQKLLKYILGFEFVITLTTLIFPFFFLFDKKVMWKE